MDTIEQRIHQYLKEASGYPVNARLGQTLDTDPYFLADYTKGQFVADLIGIMRKKGMTKRQFAQRAGKSPQYIGRVLNENANFTIQSMVELVCALGCTLTIRAHEPDEQVSADSPDVFALSKHHKQTTSRNEMELKKFKPMHTEASPDEEPNAA